MGEMLVYHLLTCTCPALLIRPCVICFVYVGMTTEHENLGVARLTDFFNDLVKAMILYC